ncbi:MAG: hypothetical protein RL077_3301, partial [Verrucomicrobiota bacterium]
ATRVSPIRRTGDTPVAHPTDRRHSCRRWWPRRRASLPHHPPSRAPKKQLLQVVSGKRKLFLPVGAKTCFGGEAPWTKATLPPHSEFSLKFCFLRVICAFTVNFFLPEQLIGNFQKLRPPFTGHPEPLNSSRLQNTVPQKKRPARLRRVGRIMRNENQCGTRFPTQRQQ